MAQYIFLHTEKTFLHVFLRTFGTSAKFASATMHAHSKVLIFTARQHSLVC